MRPGRGAAQAHDRGVVLVVVSASAVIVGTGAIVSLTCGSSRPFELSLTIAAAVATLAAVWYAADAAREAHALRREDRLARLPERVGELRAALYLAQTSTYHPLGQRWFDVRGAQSSAAVGTCVGRR